MARLKARITHRSHLLLPCLSTLWATGVTTNGASNLNALVGVQVVEILAELLQGEAQEAVSQWSKEIGRRCQSDRAAGSRPGEYCNCKCQGMAAETLSYSCRCVFAQRGCPPCANPAATPGWLPPPYMRAHASCNPLPTACLPPVPPGRGRCS